MSILSSQFDIVSVDNQMALAALAQVLAVDTSAQSGSTLYSTTGTPVTPSAIAFAPGTVVSMGTTGLAGAATATDLSAGSGYTNLPQMFFVTVDGNTDYSGRFVRKLTVLHGGFTMLTDQYSTVNGGSFTPGQPVTVISGLIVPRANGTADYSKFQIYGFVGPAGLDSVNGVLQVIVPQGVSTK